MKPKCNVCGGKGFVSVKTVSGYSLTICRHCKPAKGKLISS